MLLAVIFTNSSGSKTKSGMTSSNTSAMICLSETSSNQSCKSSRSRQKCFSNHTSYQIIHNYERWKLNHSPQNTTPSYIRLCIHRLLISRSIIKTCQCEYRPPPPHGYLTPFNIICTFQGDRLWQYPTSSRLQQNTVTTTSKWILKLLRLEDQQLHILNENTKNLWGIRKNQDHDEPTS